MISQKKKILWYQSSHLNKVNFLYNSNKFQKNNISYIIPYDNPNKVMWYKPSYLNRVPSFLGVNKNDEVL